MTTGSKATELAFRLHLPISWIVKKTIYSQFCGGETLEEISGVVDKLNPMHVDAILDYGVEGKETEEDFERTKNELIRTIRYAKSKKNVPYISCKVTGLTQFSLLEKLDKDVLLNADESAEKEKLYARMRSIAQEAADAGIGLFVDAEESWIQYAIDELVFILMREFNKQRTIIFHTAQLYRHDRLQFCKTALQDAKEHNYFTGLKLVRGAYMEKERKRAQEKNYPSPIQPDKQSTDRDYDLALVFCLDNIDRIAFCAATHNERSSLYLAEEMDRRNIPHDHPGISFSQLYGMSDQITYNLAKAGYHVSKYLPFGPVKDVIPYLIRRAQENTSVSGQMSRELSLISKEIKRRGI